MHSVVEQKKEHIKSFKDISVKQRRLELAAVCPWVLWIIVYQLT